MKNSANSKVSLVYARALFNAAKENDVITDIVGDIVQVKKILGYDEESLYKMLSFPIVEQDQKKAIILKVFSKRINDLLLKFMNLLIIKNRFSNIDGIFDMYNEMVDELSGIYRGEIKASKIPNDENKKKIVDSIQILLNKKISVDFVEDQDLVAGFSASVGSYKLEYSFDAHLKQIEKKLIRG